MITKKRKCKFCKESFQPFQPMQSVCSPPKSCAWEYQKLLKKNKEASEWRKIKSELKEKLKTHGDYLKDLQKIFNTWIRNRDKDRECISCGRSMAGRKGDASHYYSVGSSPSLRFNEDNVHLACVPCNQHLHGNIAEYAIRLPQRIGQERFDALIEKRNSVLKLSVPEIKELICKYKL